MLNHSTLPMPIASNAINDPDVTALLAQSQPGAVSFYPVDSMVYAQGDANRSLYLVEFGTVRICQLTTDGRRQITSFCYAGDVFGLEPGEEHVRLVWNRRASSANRSRSARQPSGLPLAVYLFDQAQCWS